MPIPDPFDARRSLGAGLPDYVALVAIGDRIDLSRAPVTLKILLENVLRHADGGADIFMSQQEGHGRQAGLRPTKKLSGGSSGMVKPERMSGSRTARIC